MSCMTVSLLALLTVDSVYDIRKREIPLVFTLAGTAALAAVNCCIFKTPGFKTALGMAPGLLLILLGFFGGGGIGAGDGFVFLAVGAVFPFIKCAAVLFFALLTGTFFGAAIMKLKKKRKEELPFVPFILVGTLITIFMF